MATALKQPHQKELFGHPVGLYILFFTELWERFSYYGMRAILTLYMLAKVSDDNPGLGWDEGKALAIYGWYTMLVYVASIPGGIIADKILGQRKSVMIGGWLLVAGHGVLSIEQNWAFYSGLLLIILGVGMLKPNISTMVGGLYQEGDPRRDKGFSIFYIGINVGAAVASIVVGIVAKEYGWHYGFGLAAIGMIIGQLVYVYGTRFLTHVGSKPKKVEAGDHNVSLNEIFVQMFTTKNTLLALLLLTVISLVVPLNFMEKEVLAYIIFFLFLTLVVGFMMTIYQDLESKIQKDRYIVLLLSFLIVIVFWGAFEQAGGLLNIYAQQKTDRFLPAFDYMIPAAFFQSLNPTYIIIFGLPVAIFWQRLKNRGKEASSIFKMAVGVIIMGLGFVFMVFATNQYANEGSSAIYWLFLAYLLHTLGELSASPVALSFITKLAPVKYGALMMGVYFAATGLGNKVAGIIGESSQAEPIRIELSASPNEVKPLLKDNQDSVFVNNKAFRIKTQAFLSDNTIAFENAGISEIFNFQSDTYREEYISRLENYNASPNEKLDVFLSFDYKDERYVGQIIVDRFQTDLEYRTFAGITIFCVIFGVLVILLLKPLKRLTHGAEDKEIEGLEQEKYELADEDIN